jgi:hypothetical protein
VTGPNPDAELDWALGVDRLPPATVTEPHRARAGALLRAANCTWRTHEQRDADQERMAQAIADAEQRGAARILAERAAAGTPTGECRCSGKRGMPHAVWCPGGTP